MEIKEQIKLLREKTGLNRRDFSAHFGIPLRTIEDWEAGKRKPPEYLPRLMFYQIALESREAATDIIFIPDFPQSFCNVSVIKEADNQKVIVIHDIIFKSRQNICWNDVEKYLEQYVGDFYTLAEENEKIYIGKDLPDEYANSKYTRSLHGNLAKAKANMAQAIPELIQISTNKTFSLNKNVKHNLDAKFGWYRYDSRVAIPVYINDEIERYNVFKIRMIIRHDADGKKYLYDIINIKKNQVTRLARINSTYGKKTGSF